MIKIGKTKKRNLWLIIGFLLFSIPIGVFSYYANQPIFSRNYIEDDFEDKIVGIFPIGWLSAVHPLNVKVVSDNGNNVMQVKSAGSQDVTEVCRRFKKTSIGIIQCKIKIQDVNTRFVIHIPQLDREYNPYDDIIITFLAGGIYVVGEENLITLDDGDNLTFWERVMLLNSDTSWAIDEQSLEDSVPVMKYIINYWYSIGIDFNKDNFLLAINGNPLGIFNYPKYSPSYFASLYFVAMATPTNFKFYVDNVRITLSQPVDYIHPANIFLLILIPIFVIGFYFLYKRKRK